MPRVLTALLLAAIALGLLAAPSEAFRLGVGGFGFRNYSIGDMPNTDLHSGGLYGAKARFSLIPLLLAAEPMITFVDYGEFGVNNISTEGSLTAFEINAVLGGVGGGLGPRFYHLIGLGSYKVKVDPGDTVTKAGWNIGTGAEIGLWPQVAVDVSARFRWISTEGDAIKDLGLYAGVNYYFGL